LVIGGAGKRIGTQKITEALGLGVEVGVLEVIVSHGAMGPIQREAMDQNPLKENQKLLAP
jgi:translation initiation factor IF-3